MKISRLPEWPVFKLDSAMTDPFPRPSASSEGDMSSVGADQARTDRLAMRAVHRAMGELRRGTPIILRAPSPLVLVAAETVGDDGLAEFAAHADGPTLVLLADSRATAALRRPLATMSGITALRLRGGAIGLPELKGLADPTFEQLPLDGLSGPVEAPAAADAAIALTKLARLLPAVLASSARPMANAGLLEVDATDVLAYPGMEAATLTRVAEASVPLEGARDTRIVAFRAADAGVEHLAILIGHPEQDTAAPLTRIHSECFTGDLLGSLRCDCGPQLRQAIARMAEEGSGILLYLAQEGRGIGIGGKLRAYTLQDQGADTLDANRALGWQADERNFLIAARMLQQLGVGKVRLLTNNPDKIAAIEACGIKVQRREAHKIPANGVNDFYMATKAARFGHLLG